MRPQICTFFFVVRLRFVAGLFESKNRSSCASCSSLGNFIDGSWQLIHTNKCSTFIFITPYGTTTYSCSDEPTHEASCTRLETKFVLANSLRRGASNQVAVESMTGRQSPSVHQAASVNDSIANFSFVIANAERTSCLPMRRPAAFTLYIE